MSGEADSTTTSPSTRGNSSAPNPAHMSQALRYQLQKLNENPQYVLHKHIHTLTQIDFMVVTCVVLCDILQFST